MKKYYVYILKCSDDSYYTGFTSNLNLRIEAHHSDADKDAYPFQRRPLQLVFQTEFTMAAFALEAKKQIKKWSRTKKEALINGEFKKLSKIA